jgi:ribosome-binding factor A
MAGRRVSRLNDQLREEISDIIHRRLKDPRIGFVTVTKVSVTADLSRASVYVSIMGEPDDISTTISCLDRASGFMRGELGRRLRIKRIPELRFRYDDSCVKGARIDSILRDLREEGNGEDLQSNN